MLIQLLYFTDCPNVELARSALGEALRAEGIEEPFEEIDVESAHAPSWARGWGSPTILIDGEDVSGQAPSTSSCCRLYAGGAPAVDDVRERLRAARDRPPATS